MRMTPILQGDHRISSDPDETLTTVLGSCIAACLWDPRAQIGGMNHFLLPDGPAGDAASHRYGLHAMELLINALLRHGAGRQALRAKLFGGGRMLPHLPDIGARNAAFARDFLRREGIPCVGGSIGGQRGRRVRFHPTDGRAMQLLLPSAEVHENVSATTRTGEVLLF